jgi:hypothetical protein
MKSLPTTAIVTLASLLVMILSPGIGCAEAKQVSYSGTWQSTGDLDFGAKIKNNRITVTWKVDEETSGLYWKGSFSSRGQTITSVGDRRAMDDSLLGSSDKTKKFTYENGKLMFKFSIMGENRKISLVKSN